MPLYDFKNNETGEVIEVKRSIHDQLPSYIECGGKRYDRVFLPQPVIYRTFGFYSTDNLDPIEKWRKENLGKGD